MPVRPTSKITIVTYSEQIHQLLSQEKLKVERCGRLIQKAPWDLVIFSINNLYQQAGQLSMQEMHSELNLQNE
jgi:hypothetical protein